MTKTRQSDTSPRGVRAVASVSAVGIAVHLALRFSPADLRSLANVPLYVALLTGGLPLLVQLIRKLWAGEFGSDFLAGVSIVTAIVLREYLVATIEV
jgi:cation transport ATPase